MDLGKVFNSKIDDEKQFENLINDVDFSNRSVLKIITSCKFEALLSIEDPNAENLMNNMYVGKGANKCDGNILGFSTLMHILATRPNKQESMNVHFIDMITCGFNA